MNKKESRIGIEREILFQLMIENKENIENISNANNNLSIEHSESINIHSIGDIHHLKDFIRSTDGEREKQ